MIDLTAVYSSRPSAMCGGAGPRPVCERSTASLTPGSPKPNAPPVPKWPKRGRGVKDQVTPDRQHQPESDRDAARCSAEFGSTGSRAPADAVENGRPAGGACGAVLGRAPVVLDLPDARVESHDAGVEARHAINSPHRRPVKPAISTSALNHGRTFSAIRYTSATVAVGRSPPSSLRSRRGRRPVRGQPPGRKSTLLRR
jgi:hypothetical protein